MSIFSQTTTSLPELREANKLQFQAQRDAERVRSAALVAVWLLIPFAIGALAYVLLAYLLLLRERLSDDFIYAEFTVPFWPWLILTLILQAAYWSWLSTPWEKGLWALIPLVGLIPTFMIARQVLLTGQVGSTPTSPPTYQP